MPTSTMDQVTAALNSWGARFADVAGPMLLQSTVVAAVLLALVWAGSRIRPAFRYALLMLILLKLMLPPSLSFPTGWAYWVKKAPPLTHGQLVHATGTDGRLPANQPDAIPASFLSAEAVMLLIWIAGIGVLSSMIVVRYRKVARFTGTPAPGELQRELDVCRTQMGVRRSLRLHMSATCASPAVYGLLKPVIAIPTLLAERLSPTELRHVLLHELAHVRRGDLFVNHAQVLLQVLHWFNPLLWIANAAIRRVREEAVDDLVMARSGVDAESYPATLVSVARMAFAPRLLGLGFIGIMESKAALKRRVARLVQNPVVPSVRLGWARIGAVAAVAAVLLPMARPNPGDKPAELGQHSTPAAQLNTPTSTAVTAKNPVADTDKTISGSKRAATSLQSGNDGIEPKHYQNSTGEADLDLLQRDLNSGNLQRVTRAVSELLRQGYVSFARDEDDRARSLLMGAAAVWNQRVRQVNATQPLLTFGELQMDVLNGLMNTPGQLAPDLALRLRLKLGLKPRTTGADAGLPDGLQIPQ